MTQVVIVGAGVIGAAIAYELSAISGLNIALVDAQEPGQGSTGAALGVLMGVISRKTKGRAWALRQKSLERLETLIPELEALTQQTIAVNRQGILLLQSSDEDFTPWQRLQALRQSQGYPLELWDLAMVKKHCPQVSAIPLGGAIYSPRDRQIDPRTFTQALVLAAQMRGVHTHFGLEVLGLAPTGEKKYLLPTTQGSLEAKIVIISAGLGSSQLTSVIQLQPVTGQALEVRLDQPLGLAEFQPVLSYHDIHLVPLSGGHYWIGATVEFPTNPANFLPDPLLRDSLWQTVITTYPGLAQAQIVRTWSGQRPRPDGESAPVIRPLAEHPGVLLATGHYRNGVLLAPATALVVKDWVISML